MTLHRIIYQKNTERQKTIVLYPVVENMFVFNKKIYWQAYNLLHLYLKLKLVKLKKYL